MKENRNLPVVFFSIFGLTLLSQAAFASAKPTVIQLHSNATSQAWDLDDLKEARITDMGLEPTMVSVQSTPGLGEVIDIADGLISLGQKLWKIVEWGKATSHIDLGVPLSVLPRTVEDPAIAFESMENWSDPKARRFHIEFLNWRNAVAVSFDYLVNFQYAGDYNGKGKYLYGISVAADQVSVGWGWDLNASTEHLATANSGSKGNPIAGTRIAVKYLVNRKVLGKEYSGSHVIFIKGNGEIGKISDEQDKPDQE